MPPLQRANLTSPLPPPSWLLVVSLGQVTVKSAQLLKGLGAAAGALKAMIASAL